MVLPGNGFIEINHSMLFLKIIAIILLAADAIIGFRFFLNVIRVRNTSKYSPTATALYAFIFLGLAIAGFYYLIFSPGSPLVFWISMAPWALMGSILFISMVTGSYK